MKLCHLEADAFEQLVNVASDLALVLDKDGVIQEVAVHKAELAALGCQDWVGRPWISTVTPECHTKVQEMLVPHSTQEQLRWRHVNHAMPQGADLPVQYAVMSFGSEGQFLALGRDMEAIAVLQRRLIETQQSIERDYLRLRHVETKYRILFETGSEAVLLVDGISLRVVDANSSAQGLVKDSPRKLVGRDVTDCFEPGYRDEIQSLLRMAHATGRAETCRAKFVGATGECVVSASVFRQESGPHFLMRLLPQGLVSVPNVTPPQQLLFSEALENAPDGFVLTDRAGVIKSANAEFLAMLGATALSQIHGQPLENWFVRGGADWRVLATNLRAQAAVREFAAELRVMAGAPMAVEIAALTLNTDQVYYAFYIRDVERRRSQELPLSSGIAGSVAELSRLVGRMPMKDIVGETVDMIEKMCIQSALELTKNNRASAAEMLGLSRQSLYVKLRRFEMVSDTEVSSLH